MTGIHRMWSRSFSLARLDGWFSSIGVIRRRILSIGIAIGPATDPKRSIRPDTSSRRLACSNRAVRDSGLKTAQFFTDIPSQSSSIAQLGHAPLTTVRPFQRDPALFCSGKSEVSRLCELLDGRFRMDDGVVHLSPLGCRRCRRDGLGRTTYLAPSTGNDDLDDLGDIFLDDLELLDLVRQPLGSTPLLCRWDDGSRRQPRTGSLITRFPGRTASLAQPTGAIAGPAETSLPPLGCDGREQRFRMVRKSFVRGERVKVVVVAELITEKYPINGRCFAIQTNRDDSPLRPERYPATPRTQSHTPPTPHRPSDTS